MSSKTFYVTTPIYYVNDSPHIGHAYTTVAADAIARYKRLKGFDARLLTGTDEHGQKVEKAAKAAGLEPRAFTDSVSVRFKDLWTKLNISHDDFIRTTEPRHKAAAAHIWRVIAEKGGIYLGEYEDWYCTPCENFLTATQLVDNKCPDCGRAVERLKESSYFFKLSEHGERLLKFIDENPGFIRPESKKNEIVSFVREGLRDLSVSRTTFTWGIPVPGDPRHVMYVWFDALTNYLSAIGYPDESYKKFWDGEVLHIIGKDILRFHSVYWPAFLFAAGINPPKRVYAHGWWTVDGEKMSKSRGNVVDPVAMIDKYGADQFRYFLLREVPFGLDGDFSVKALEGRINGDLANDLGNLLSRSVSMIEKYRGGVVPPRFAGKDGELEARARAVLTEHLRPFDAEMDGLQFSVALGRLWDAVREMNAYVDKSAPWKLAKEDDAERLSNVLYTLAEGLRIIAVYAHPFMPASSDRVWAALGMDKSLSEMEKKGSGFDFEKAVAWGHDFNGAKVKNAGPLFPRIQ